MRNLIVILALVILTTACKTNKSGAEISALGESLMSTSATSGDTHAAGPAIDTSKRGALTYAAAQTACTDAGRNLCTIDQYTTAYNAGHIDYTFATPGNYWVVTQLINSVFANEFQATTGGINYLVITPTLTRNFYCCL
jgi:hypothetical protein